MPSKPSKISSLGEKKLIERLLSRSQNNIPKSSFFTKFFDEKSQASLQDDAALLDLGDQYLVVTSDLLLESSHFPKKMNSFDKGRKSVVVNVSDLAAMGAKPLGIIISLGLPPNLNISDFDELIEGILTTCKEHEMALLGGDTNQAEELTICGTALGIVEKNKVLMKSGAKIGDFLAVTGHLGMAAAGFKLIINESSTLIENFYEIIEFALRPNPRVNEGLQLSNNSFVTSATDITDGLASEMGEIIEKNPKKIGIIFYENKIPINDSIRIVANNEGLDPLDLVLYYGEDFEILFTISKEGLSDLKAKLNFDIIGKITDSGRVEMVDKEGKINIITPQGYEHLQSD